MRAWWLAAALTLIACKGDKAKANDQDRDRPHREPVASVNVGSGSATGTLVVVAPSFDWAACEAALRTAATAPLDARPQLVLDGCAVCGPWAPILGWSTPQASKGPARADIDAALSHCDAFCDGTAKSRFMSALDDARGSPQRTPWRLLGEACKQKISAMPDARFASALLFAFDRVARAAVAHGGNAASLALAIELPLPAVSLTGIGVVLPDVTGDVTQTAGPIAITVIAGTYYAAKLPRARMSGDGLAVDLGGYPGDQVALDKLPAALAKLEGAGSGAGSAAGADASAISISILAPPAAPAETLVPLVAAAAKLAPVYLAANAAGAPDGWDLPGNVPVALDAAAPGDKSAIAITHQMSAQDLANELARRAKTGAKKAALALTK